MDPIKAARKLQQLLIIHDKVVKQICELENQTKSISRHLFGCDLINENPDNSLHYMRHSTTMGVKAMLDNCRFRLFEQVQKISRQIIATIQADDTINVQQTELESSNSPVTMDTAAVQYTSNDMLRCRRD